MRHYESGAPRNNFFVQLLVLFAVVIGMFGMVLFLMNELFNIAMLKLRTLF